MIPLDEVPEITLPRLGPMPSLLDGRTDDVPEDSPDPYQEVVKKHSSRRTVRKLNTAEREQRIMEMRLRGMSQTAIAAELGVTPAAVSLAVGRAFRKANELQADRVDQYRQLQGQRLDALLTALWPRIEQGDVLAIAQAVKIEERRAKLMGLDAPQKVQVGLDLEVLPDAQLRAIAARLGMAVDVPAIPHFDEKDVVPSIDFDKARVVVTGVVVNDTADRVSNEGSPAGGGGTLLSASLSHVDGSEHGGG